MGLNEFNALTYWRGIKASRGFAIRDEIRMGSENYTHSGAGGS